MSRGQAYLPDSTTSAGETATLGNTDEMLSKLAGEEIDKLLAEAEVERPPEPPAPVAQKAGESAAAVDSDLSTQIDELLSERAAPTAPVAPVAPAAPSDPAEEARLKKLAEELEVDQPAPAAAAETAKETPHDEEATFDLTDHRPPIWLRWLEWMNQPLNGAPDWVRPIIGKLAILTLLNSLVVIGYVVFRRHH